MSAIGGVLALDGSTVDEDAIGPLVAAMRHRGPDGRGVLADGPLAVAHLLHATLPEDRLGEQPFLLDDGTVVVADGRVDNRDALLEALAPDADPADVSDARLMTLAWQRWGTGLADRVFGPKAFVAYAPAEGTLSIVRDEVGIRPLYYHHAPGHRFAFATELPALLALDGVDATALEEDRILDHLTAHLEDKEVTFYAGIRRLPPAHVLTVRVPRASGSGGDGDGDDAISLERYWDPFDVRVDERMSLEEAADGFRERMTRAVESRLRTRDPAPVGAFLSGGIDSSTVACLAHRLADPDRPFHTFTVVFDDVPASNERDWAELVVDHLRQAGGDGDDAGDGQGAADEAADGPRRPDLKTHFLPGDHQGPFADHDALHRQLGHPWWATNLFVHREVLKAAGREGVPVLLDGLDGDTTVGHGVGRLGDLARRGRILKAALEARAVTRSAGEPFGPAVMAHVVRPLLQGPNRGLARPVGWMLRRVSALRSRRRDDDGAQGPRAKAPEASADPTADPAQRADPAAPPKTPAPAPAAGPSPAGPAGPYRTHLAALTPAAARRASARIEAHLPRTAYGATTEPEAHRANLGAGVVPFAMEINDVVAARLGVEVRYPFFDRRVVEHCLRVPSRYRLRDGLSRYHLRPAMEGILPEAVRWRGGKSSMAANFQEGLLVRDRALLDDVLADADAHVGDWVAEGTLEALRKAPEDQPLHVLWAVATLALWRRDEGI